jgi:hypothetical protein
VEVRATKQLVDLKVLCKAAAPSAHPAAIDLPRFEEQFPPPKILHVDQLRNSVADAPQEIFQLRRRE